MKVEVLRHPSVDDWCEVLRRCLVTIGKKSSKIPDIEWRKKMLKCRHSPIRYLQFSFLITDIPYWLHVEFVRHHIGVQFYVKSSRDDRNSDSTPRAEKPQGSPVNMIVDMNAEALINIYAKRSCGCATKEMQELMELIKTAVLEFSPEFKEVLVPPCVRIGKCEEFFSCGKKALFFKMW